MVKRIDPLGLGTSEVTAGSDSNGETATPVTSRLDILDTSVCPIQGCGRKMQPILAARDIPSYICWEHRVVLPQPDPQFMPPQGAVEIHSNKSQ